MLACSAWLGSRLVSVLDSDCSHGHTHRASVHQAVKLVAALLRVAAVTAGLAESNGAYRRIYDSRHLQADCQEPGSAPEPDAR